MPTLIIYDSEGYILSVRQGEPEPREPIGVPFLWVDIPEGKQLKITNGIGVDVSVTPHKAILEAVPPSETDLIRLQMAESNAELFEMVMQTGGM